MQSTDNPETSRAQDNMRYGRSDHHVRARTIEQSLKRVYDATLSEALPPRFHELLNALREKESRK